MDELTSKQLDLIHKYSSRTEDAHSEADLINEITNDQSDAVAEFNSQSNGVDHGTKLQVALLRSLIPEAYTQDSAITYMLLLLSVVRDGYFNNIPTGEGVDLRLLIEEQSNLPNQELYRNVLHSLEYNPSTENAFKLSSNTIRFLLSTHWAKEPGEEFALYFDKILEEVSSRESGTGSGSLLPPELSAFAAHLIPLSSGAKVFNPFAGLASFGLNLPKDVEYLGQELHQMTYNLGRLRAVAHSRDLASSFDYRQEDSIHSWPYSEQFDLVIASPPFGMRLPRQQYGDVADLRQVSNFLIQEGLKVLKPAGTLIAMVPVGFLYAGGVERNIRERLIDNGLLKRVITFPEGMLNDTYISFAMLVLHAAGRPEAGTELIDARAFTEKVGRKVSFNSDQLLELLGPFGDLRSAAGRSSITRVDRQQVANHDYILTPSRYLLPAQESGVALSELLKPMKGQRVSAGTQGYLTTIKDLIASEHQEYTITSKMLDLDSSTGKDHTLPRSTKQIESPALLIAVAGEKLKPTFFSADQATLPVFIAPQVKALQVVDPQRVHLPYLINELRQPRVREQLDAFRIGTGIPRLRLKDFLRVRIPLPPLREQELKASTLREVSEQIVQLQQDKQAIAEGSRIERRRRFASLKHTMGRPQQSILSAAKVLKGYLQHLGQEGVALNQAYAAFYEQERTMTDTLQGIIDDIDFISRLMEEGENGLQVTSYPRVWTPVQQVYLELTRIHVQDCKFKLEIFKDEQETSWSKVSVDINLDLFRIMIENLVTNANKHGFDKLTPSNTVRIDMAVVDYHLLLEIRNNGKPFPRNFGKEQFTQEFSRTQDTKGEGIGGYQIDQIATYFGGADWTLTSDSTAAFPVVFTFRFPVAYLLATF